MSIVQPPTVRPHPVDAAAVLGLLLLGIGAYLTWSLGVAFVLVGVVLLLAVVAGHLRRENAIHQFADEQRKVNP